MPAVARRAGASPAPPARLSAARPGARRAAALLALGAFAVAGCSRDRSAADAGTITAAEEAAFTAPADSSLSVAQVERYLRTTLAQLDLLGAEAASARQQMEAARRARAAWPDTAPRSRRPPSAQKVWSEFVNGTFVRAARRQGYNPAELTYVRDRLARVSGHLLASELHASPGRTAELLRQQAAALRNTPGVTREQIDAMLRGADRAEQQTLHPPPPRLAQNLEALSRARGALSEGAWRRVTAVAAGVGLADLGQLSHEEGVRRLDTLREVHRAALENREPPS